MSNSSVTTALGVIPGGTPTKHQDLVPSIGFLAGYCLLIPFMLWRGLSGNSRTSLLIRPAIFLIARIVTFGIRAVMGTDYDKGKTVSKNVIQIEDILLGVGFIMLTEPTLHLLFKHKLGAMVNFHSTADHARRIIAIITTWLLYASIFAGVYAGQMASKPDKTHEVRTLKIANTVIALGCVLIIAVISLWCFFFNPGKNRNIEHQHRSALLLFFISCCLIIATGFRFINAAKTPPSSSSEQQANMLKSSTKLQFYVFQATPEILATAPFFIFNLRELFQTYLKVPFEYQGPESEYLNEQGNYRFGEYEKHQGGGGGRSSNFLFNRLTFGYY